MAVLHHFPYVTKGAFRREYDALRFENSQDHFSAWCEGRTGYPIVDAAMRQINQSGYMHNRLRMIVASLRFDPDGRFFRLYLPELARVPNQFLHEPWTMSEDVQRSAGCAIGRNYPAPIVDHAFARKKTLALYGAVKRR